MYVLFFVKQVENFKEHWIDVHDPEVKCLRVTNFSNYDFASEDTTICGVGLEYNCFEEDPIWRMSDEEITSLAVKDLELMNLVEGVLLIARS